MWAVHSGWTIQCCIINVELFKMKVSRFYEVLTAVWKSWLEKGAGHPHLEEKKKPLELQYYTCVVPGKELVHKLLM